jgi:hypothetical protein
MRRRADQRRWIEPVAGEAGEEARRRGSLRVSHLVASMDEAARRHPAAIAAALFCGGIVTGTWLGRARSRGRGGSGQAAELAPAASGSGGMRQAAAPAAGPAAPGAAAPPAPSVTRRRNPIGSPSVLQH